MAKSKALEEMKNRRIVNRPMVMEKDPVHNREENLQKALEALREALGEEWVTDEPSILCGYARDQSATPAVYPHLVCMPSSTEEVQAVYRIANEYLVDVMPYGTGLTTGGLTIPPFGGMLCDLRRMDRIIELDGENMFAVVEPGVNYLMLQAAAQRAGCRVLNPSTSATAGVISNHAFCNINTMASKYGFGMDNIIDVEMVLPTGDIFKTGPLSYDAVKGHVPGPGPDMSSMFRYTFGTMGIVTKMTIRLYPEPECHQQILPILEEDRLSVMVDALYLLAQDNLTIELASGMNSFIGIFLGDTNRESSTVVSLMPRHIMITIFGGDTQAEADLKAEITERALRERCPMLDFMPVEALETITEKGELFNLDKWLKYFNVTVRVMRVRGSFLIGALIDKLENMVGVEKLMRDACTNQVGTTDDALPPDDASTYLQPYHMGRAAYMEYDMYTNQSDKDDLLRITISYLRATFTAMGKGMIMAAGAGPLTKGLIPMMDLAMNAVQPNAVNYMDAFTRMKMAVDPNNISNRRWEYDTQTAKKFIFFI